jgi:squalene-hopene/tetraprenyl-beta-curcumene cyclase
MSGLRSLLYAGVARSDARVKAAVTWIRNNYDFTSNPGMGIAGLYHYYHVCAKTLLALGLDEIEDARGIKHNWRADLCTEIVRRQRKDGSWSNENGCWMENVPHMATAHALLALSYCQQSSAKTA